MSETLAKIKELFAATKRLFENKKPLTQLTQEQQQQWTDLLKEGKIGFENYQSDVGTRVFKSTLDTVDKNAELLFTEDQFMNLIKEVFTRIDDKRCQVGQVFSTLEDDDEFPHDAFSRNVNSVVLILDKKDLEITPASKSGYMEIKSTQCFEVLEFPNPNDPEVRLNLCESFYYSTEMIPLANRIFGSGVFIAPDKIATAAHVVYEAAESGVKPEDMIFVGAHFVYEWRDYIWVKKSKMYQLDQKVIQKNNQMVNGTKGDSAWLQVKPLYEAEYPKTPSGHPGNLSIKIPDIQNMEAKQPVYSLGHGFGVPMKLSFGGTVEYLGDNGWLGCNLDIFPGNSGSPVFHANTHELLGIISGPDNLWRQLVDTENCINVKINNDHGRSVETSQIQLLIQKIINQ